MCDALVVGFALTFLSSSSQSRVFRLGHCCGQARCISLFFSINFKNSSLQKYSSPLVSLKFCHEKWVNISVARYAKLIETYPKRFAAVIAAKVALQSIDFGAWILIHTQDFWVVVFFILIIVCVIMKNILQWYPCCVNQMVLTPKNPF